ncbi:MAG: hypothetical protein ACI9HK_002947 [Pirellulaceae bacterium]|jgi:hypothetical protein
MPVFHRDCHSYSAKQTTLILLKRYEPVAPVQVEQRRSFMELLENLLTESVRTEID